MSTVLNDGGPAFPVERVMNGNGEIVQWESPGMSLRAYFTAKAVQGMLAAESDEYGVIAVRVDPNTGQETLRTSVYPLNPETKQEDYSKPMIPTTVIRTREQEIARQAVAIADAAIAELLKQ